MQKIAKTLLQLIVIIAVIVGAFLLRDVAADNAHVRDFVQAYGYGGTIIIGAISGLNIVVPIPAVAFLPLFIEVGLSVPLTILFIAIGTTLGDSIGYLFGKAGRNIATLQNNTIAQRFEVFCKKWCTRYRTAPFIALLLFASFVPFPNEVLVIPMAFMGFRYRELLPWLFVGNIIFNALAGSGLVTVAGLI